MGLMYNTIIFKEVASKIIQQGLKLYALSEYTLSSLEICLFLKLPPLENLYVTDIKLQLL